MTHLERLGRWLADLSYEAIPEDARRAARFQLLDMIAAVHAAARSQVAVPVRDGLLAFAAEGRATCLATGTRHGPTDAASANAAYSMAEDYDDIVWMGHTCHSAVFASLAVAEHEGRDGRDLVTAIVAANEIGGRLGASCLLGPLNGQMWTFLHLACAAAATAKLLSLDAETTTHALAIALSQPNFALQPGFLVPTSKLLAASTPAQTGIQAGYFARAGMTGHAGILEDPKGFCSRFSYLPLPMMLGGLGEEWVTETLAFKTYPGCHYFQTALTAIDRIRARDGWGELRADDVRSVRIDTTKLACEATRFASEYVAGAGLSPVSVNFDLAQSAALLIHAGKLSPAELDASYLAENEAALRRLASRIEVRHEPGLTAQTIDSVRGLRSGRAAMRALGIRDAVRLAKRYRQEYRSELASASEALRLARGVGQLLRQRRTTKGVTLAFPSRVTVDLADGRRAIEQVDVPVGSFASPDAERELEAKFLRETAALGDARVAFQMGLRVESGDLTRFVRAVSSGGAH